MTNPRSAARAGTALAGWAALAIAACGSPSAEDFTAAAFEPIPQLHLLDYSRVEPAEAWDYWELRAAGLTEEDSVIGVGGALSREELPPAVAGELAGAHPTSGFSAGCLPGYCYHYLAAVSGDEVTTVNTPEGFRAFLGGITTQEEAILSVAAGSYLWWDDGAHTGVRPVSGGWDVVVFELARDCDPVQTDRVRFRVRPDGDVAEREREVWEVTEGACI